jgi:endogenous inhibitor of DNA gyrase (YacG/DUF329 family)
MLCGKPNGDSPARSRSNPIPAMTASGFKSPRCDYIRSAMASVLPIERPASRPCPICGKPATPQHRPFCSARCAQIDLGRWLKGNYSIPTEEGPDEGDGEEAD